jgi:5-methylcytosine-specific restriction endonuclease McrA
MRRKPDIKIVVPVNERPRCIVEGCNRPGQHTGQYRLDGTPSFRKTCTKHHNINYDMKGWAYKKHRKTYCENIDGRLGFVCTTTIVDHIWQLGVDHIDTNPSNNDISNLQTLCHCCHSIKTRDDGSALTPGRKTLGLSY